MSVARQDESRAPGTPCGRCPLRRCEALRDFAPEELDFVEALKIGELRLGAGSDLLVTGTNSAHLFTLLEGWAYRYVLLEDGQIQILNFLLPGDFLGLQSSIFDVMEHSVRTLTEVKVCVFQRADLWKLYREMPSLAFDVTWLAAHEESLVDQILVTVGQRTALCRVGFLLLQLHGRLSGLGMVEKDEFEFPLTQQHIADALGLSLVHTNRIMRRLVKAGFVTRSNGRLRLQRADELAQLCGVEAPAMIKRPFI
jgi:CRP/FNR family transcriptional regulator, anaerobic regulatory protein